MVIPVCVGVTEESKKASYEKKGEVQDEGALGVLQDSNGEHVQVSLDLSSVWGTPTS